MKPFTALTAVAALVSVSGCTGPVNEQTTREMPTQYMCELLGPDYLTLPHERRAIYAELERRQANCGQQEARPVYIPPPLPPMSAEPFMSRHSFGAPPRTGMTRCQRDMTGQITCLHL